MALYDLRNHEGQPLFSVSGYADTRPVTEVQNEESDYELNRRIDIRITIRRPDAEDYEKVKSTFGEPDAAAQD